jgi:hypothetical protein
MKPAPAILRAWAKATQKCGLPCNLSKPGSAAWARDTIKETAYHESGHVAAAAFTGCEFSHITVVSLIPAVGNGKGRVLQQGTMERHINIYSPRVAFRLGLRYMLGHLAGRAAEFRICQSLDMDELEEARNEPGNDLFWADKMANLLARRNMSANRILKLTYRLTEEMLDLPPVWKAVKTLAALLLTNGKVKQGPKLQEIFGPIMDLSMRLPKWRDRLWC